MFVHPFPLWSELSKLVYIIISIFVFVTNLCHCWCEDFWSEHFISKQFIILCRLFLKHLVCKGLYCKLYDVTNLQSSINTNGTNRLDCSQTDWWVSHPHCSPGCWEQSLPRLPRWWRPFRTFPWSHSSGCGRPEHIALQLAIFVKIHFKL